MHRCRKVPNVNAREVRPRGRRNNGVRNAVIAALLALVLGFVAVPTAAFAADRWYASGVARSEGQPALSRQVTLNGARGGAASNYMRFHLVNTYSWQGQIASSVVDGHSTSFSHAKVSRAFSNCWWDYPEGNIPKSQKIGVSCAYTN